MQLAPWKDCAIQKKEVCLLRTTNRTDKIIASIIIPTKDRWKKLQKTLKAIVDNTFVNHEVIIIFDGDLKNFKRMAKKKLKTHKLACNNHPREYWQCINQGCFLATGEYIIYLADDIRPRKGWLSHAIETFERNFKDGLGLVALKSDLNEGITHAPHGMVTRKFIAMNGFLAPPVYRHYFFDTELSLRMQAMKRYACTHQIVINHDKPVKDKKFDDKIYSESWKNCWKSDELQFHLRNPQFVTALILVQPDMMDKVMQTQLWARPQNLIAKKIK